MSYSVLINYSTFFNIETENFSDINLPSITLLSFGNKTFYNSLERIKVEAQDFPFAFIKLYRDTDLESFPDFWEKNKDFILSHKRGYGYWIWKSYITLKTLLTMNDDEILCYIDAGCTLHASGMHRFLEYIDIVKNSKSGILSFRMAYKQKSWTKMDLLEMFDKSYGELGQLTACTFFIRKSKETIKLVQEWYDMCCNYHLVDDSPSIKPNDVTFTEHRHDQSIFSLLRYKYNTELIKEDQYPEGEITYDQFTTMDIPIHANRKKT